MEQTRLAPASPRVTIYEVAREAGVAISTVSRVLNSAPNVSDATRGRVLKAIDGLQYRPNRTAKALARRELSALAVAVPSFTTPSHTELLKGVRDHLHGRDIDLMLCDLGSRRPYDRLRRFLDRGAIDGLLLIDTPVKGALARELYRFCRSVVMVGVETSRTDCFSWDEAAGAAWAVEHLARQGHRRIGMIASHLPAAVDERLRGFRLGLGAAGLPFDPALVRRGESAKHGGVSEEAGYEAMSALLPTGVTAVFAAGDALAVGAWTALQEARRSVPDDVALVGFDDVKMSRYLGLSSMDRAMREVGRRATERLLSRIEGDTSPPVATRLVPRLVARRSSVRA